MKKYRITLFFSFSLLSIQIFGQYEDIDFTKFPWPNSAHTIFFEVPDLEGDIQMDGRLDEPAWTKTEAINKFYQSSSAKSTPFDARILVLKNASALVLGFDLPRIKGNIIPEKCFLTDEYNLVRSAKYVSIALDPRHNHGVYYQFVFDQEGHS